MLVVPCPKCRQNLLFNLDERPEPEPKEPWWSRLRAQLAGEVRLFDSGHARPVGEVQREEAAHPELLALFACPGHEAPGDFNELRELAAVVDWRGDPDDVLAPLAEAAEAWAVAPLWSEAEAESWRTAHELPAWQLVDELVSRFEAKELKAFDTESQGDGYGLLFVRAKHAKRAAKLATASDLEGDLRPFRRRKFA